jgi:hypothetical protein
MNRFKKFLKKWDKDGIKKSLERKRLRRQDAAEARRTPENASLSFTRFPNCRALDTFATPARDRPRVTIVTDSINEGSLYGGVGTAIILAGLLCEQHDWDLRIATRTERPDTSNIKKVWDLYGISIKRNVEFTYAAVTGSSNHQIDVAPNDIFITTSWWSTAATLPSVPVVSIYYLLQEDERMFYPYGDERLKCEFILRNSDIKFIINTQLLFDHFISEGFNNIQTNGAWFHPAFPKDLYYPRPRTGKKKLFFYARPHNPRNLFAFGVEVLEKAIQIGLIDSENWDVLFVGKHIPSIELAPGFRPTCIENLNWAEYAALIGEIDIGFSLMYTPHPSYPPLDIAASGGVVVTNRFANKRDLQFYSENIICDDLDMDAMLSAIKVAISLAENKTQATLNHQRAKLPSSWHHSLDHIIQSFRKPE